MALEPRDRTIAASEEHRPVHDSCYAALNCSIQGPWSPGSVCVIERVGAQSCKHGDQTGNRSRDD